MRDMNKKLWSSGKWMAAAAILLVAGVIGAFALRGGAQPVLAEPVQPGCVQPEPILAEPVLAECEISADCCRQNTDQ